MTQARPNGNTENFSMSRRAGNLVFVAGQASVDETGAIVTGTFAEEMHRSFANVRRVLAENGLDLPDVVKVNSYVHDPAHLPEYNALYREYFGAPLPARTTITGCLTDKIKFEVDVVAEVR
jgi:2-iminobutanoate/2-iminopropanoate deaminase